MKFIIVGLILIASCQLFAHPGNEESSSKNMLIITCHPDDWELSMGGTAYLLKDKFNIHVIIDSDGELGNTWNTTGIPDPEVGTMRVEHSTKSAGKINAVNHFLKMPDGNVFADEEAVKKTIALLKEINPEIVFLHWPIDKPDHAAASAIAMMALSKAGMMYDREIYFFEVGKLDYFIPQIYIDITPVWDIKKELVHFHERFNDDRFKEMAEESAVYHGRSNQCKYAEGFIPLHPFSNAKFNQKANCSLFDINP